MCFRNKVTKRNNEYGIVISHTNNHCTKKGWKEQKPNKQAKAKLGQTIFVLISILSIDNMNLRQRNTVLHCINCYSSHINLLVLSEEAILFNTSSYPSDFHYEPLYGAFFGTNVFLVFIKILIPNLVPNKVPI